MHKVPSKVKKITVSTLTSSGVLRPGNPLNAQSADDRELDELVPRGQPTGQLMYTDADVGTGQASSTAPKSGRNPVAAHGLAAARRNVYHQSSYPLKLQSNRCSRCNRLNLFHLFVNASLALIVFAIGILESAKCPTSNHKLPHLMITYGSLWFLKTLLDVLVKYEVKSDPILFKLTYEKICYPIEMTMSILFVALCIYLYAANGCLAVNSPIISPSETQTAPVRGLRDSSLGPFVPKRPPQPLNGHHYGGMSHGQSSAVGPAKDPEDLMMTADEPRPFSCRERSSSCLNKGTCKAICTHYEHHCVCPAGTTGNRCQFVETEAAGSEKDGRLGDDQTVAKASALDHEYEDLGHQVLHPTGPIIQPLPPHQNDPPLVPLVGEPAILADSGLQLVRDVRQSLNAPRDTTVVLDCEPITENLTYPITYMWYTVGKPMPSHISIDGGRLTIKGVTAEDTARYACEARNEVYRIKYAVDLTVIDNHDHNNQQPILPHSEEKEDEVICEHCLHDGRCPKTSIPSPLSIATGACDCRLGFSGPNCTEQVHFHEPRAAQFSGNSLITIQIVNSLPLVVASNGHLVSLHMRTHEPNVMIGQLYLDQAKFDDELHRATKITLQISNGLLLINASQNEWIIENQMLSDGRLHSIDISMNSQLGQLEVSIDKAQQRSFTFVHPSPLYANLMNARSARFYLGLEHEIADSESSFSRGGMWYNGFKGCLRETSLFASEQVNFLTQEEQGHLFVKEAWNIHPCAMVIKLEQTPMTPSIQPKVEAVPPSSSVVNQAPIVANQTSPKSGGGDVAPTDEEDYNEDYDDTVTPPKRS